MISLLALDFQYCWSIVIVILNENGNYILMFKFVKHHHEMTILVNFLCI